MLIMVREIIRNKKYQIRVNYGYEGSKHLKYSETFEGKKSDAIIRENQLKKEIKEGSFIKVTDITVSNLIDEWMQKKKQTVTQKTYYNYLFRTNVIKEKIGFIKLKNLNVKLLESFYSYLSNEYVKKDGKPLSSTTLLQYYEIINEMIEQAIIWEYIKVNPNSKISKPKKNKTNIEYYTPADVNRLMCSLEKEPVKYRALISLALDTGCRRGELTGLTWDDVDFTKNTININKITQYTNSKTGVYEKETKTVNSNRIIPFGKTTATVLKKYQIEQKERKLKLGDKWGNSKRVFTTDTGEDMHPNRPSKIFNNIIKKYDLKPIRFHALRHTSASLMIYSNVQPQIISRKLGHGSTDVTDRIYSHFFEEEFKDTANIMDEYLNVKNI